MSALSNYLNSYLQLRQQLGFKLISAGLYLRNFVHFAQERRASFVTTKLALQWATQPENIRPRQRAVRLGVVRRFAQYVSTLDPRTEVPPPKLLQVRYCRPAPYLYRDEEVLKLIEAAEQIDPCNAFKCATYATLFGLLAVTGMRVGEAITLERADVDLRQSVLTLRRAKGNKSRLLPLHSSTGRALRQYSDIRDKHYPRPSSSTFFLSEKGTALRYGTVNRWFLMLSRRIGLRKPGALHGARLHDLRHRFAIQTMLKWYRTGADVEAHLPELATYLGHGHVADTYWYLSAAPELLRLATVRWQRREGARGI
jgi:integrase/recombinase XerD